MVALTSTPARADRPKSGLTSRPVAAAGLGIMLVAISTAWGFELIGGYVPCALCLEQRMPYYIAIPLALAGLALTRRAILLGRGLLAGATACMVWGAALGVYHAGAEWSFWEGPTTCGATGAVRDAGGLLAQLETQTFVSCNLASARFLGLSFAGWNVVAATGAAVLLFAAVLMPVRRTDLRAVGDPSDVAYKVAQRAD